MLEIFMYSTPNFQLNKVLRKLGWTPVTFERCIFFLEFNHLSCMPDRQFTRDVNLQYNKMTGITANFILFFRSVLRCSKKNWGVFQSRLDYSRSTLS